MARDSSKSALETWLAGRILDRLKAEGLGPGDHITEQGLADFFGVSRTPIRTALARLQKLQAVEHRPNRGYFLAQAVSAVAATRLASGDEEDKLYYRIAEDRLRGRIAERVTEMELVRRYRTTRARITSLVSRMAREGWLERLPGHGWSFQPMLDSVKGYEQSYRFRAALEPQALRQPGYHLSREAIERCRQQQLSILEGGLATFTDAEVFEIGASLHETLVAGSANPFFIDAIRRVNSLRRLLEYRAKRGREKIAEQCREHLQLLDLLEAGKYSQAADFLALHLDYALKVKAPLVKPTRGKA